MRKNRYIQTDFIKFLLEKYGNDQDEQETSPEETQKLPQSQSEPRRIPLDDDPEDEPQSDDVDDDEVIEKLLTEYKKVKKQYESTLHHRRGR